MEEILGGVRYGKQGSKRRPCHQTKGPPISQQTQSTLILALTLAQAPRFIPTDMFDLAGFMDGDTEVFCSGPPEQYPWLMDGHQSRVLVTLFTSTV